MHPILAQFHVFGKEITLGTYGLMAIVGFASAIGIAGLLGRKFNYSADEVVNYTLLTSVGGLAGAFTVGFILFLPQRIAHGFFNFPPALVSWGGIIGGITTMAILWKKWHVDLFNLADLITPGFFVGLGMGRIGCFFAGCCFGRTTAHAIGVTFTDPMAPASHIAQPVLPTQLISAGILIALGLIFIPIVLKRKIAGSCFTGMLLVYPVKRFIIEFYRADHRSFLFGFSDGQLFSLALFCAGIAMAVYIYRNRVALGGRIQSLYYRHGNDR